MMSTSKENINFEHPLAQNWTNQQNDKQNTKSQIERGEFRPMNKQNSTSSLPIASSTSLNYSNSLNYKHQQFAKKRRESFIKMAPDIDPVRQAKRKLAIKCENVCLTYGEGDFTNYVLNGVTLSVPKGENTDV